MIGVRLWIHHLRAFYRDDRSSCECSNGRKSQTAKYITLLPNGTHEPRVAPRTGLTLLASTILGSTRSTENRPGGSRTLTETFHGTYFIIVDV
jgi:hypothetical protein